MVSSNLWTKIGVTLSKLFSRSIVLPFAGLPTVIIGNYLQLSPVKVDLYFQNLLVEVI